jgi:hypothetical protein
MASCVSAQDEDRELTGFFFGRITFWRSMSSDNFLRLESLKMSTGRELRAGGGIEPLPTMARNVSGMKLTRE